MGLVCLGARRTCAGCVRCLRVQMCVPRSEGRTPLCPVVGRGGRPRPAVQPLRLHWAAFPGTCNRTLRLGDPKPQADRTRHARSQPWAPPPPFPSSPFSEAVFGPGDRHRCLPRTLSSLKGDAAALGLSGVPPTRVPGPLAPRRRRYTLTPARLRWDHFNLTYRCALAWPWGRGRGRPPLSSLSLQDPLLPSEPAEPAGDAAGPGCRLPHVERRVPLQLPRGGPRAAQRPPDRWAPAPAPARPCAPDLSALCSPQASTRSTTRTAWSPRCTTASMAPRGSWPMPSSPRTAASTSTTASTGCWAPRATAGRKVTVQAGLLEASPPQRSGLPRSGFGADGRRDLPGWWLLLESSRQGGEPVGAPSPGSPELPFPSPCDSGAGAGAAFLGAELTAWAQNILIFPWLRRRAAPRLRSSRCAGPRGAGPRAAGLGPGLPGADPRGPQACGSRTWCTWRPTRSATRWA